MATGCSFRSCFCTCLCSAQPPTMLKLSCYNSMQLPAFTYMHPTRSLLTRLCVPFLPLFTCHVSLLPSSFSCHCHTHLLLAVASSIASTHCASHCAPSLLSRHVCSPVPNCASPIIHAHAVCRKPCAKAAFEAVCARYQETQQASNRIVHHGCTLYSLEPSSLATSPFCLLLSHVTATHLLLAVVPLRHQN